MTHYNITKSGQVRRKSASPERAIQVAVVNLLRKHAREDVIYYHPANGGARHMHVAIKLRAEGVQKGVPDLAFVLPGGKAAFLELKAPKGRVSPEQIEFRNRVLALGGQWAIAYSIDEAIAVLNIWNVFRRPMATKAEVAA